MGGNYQTARDIASVNWGNTSLTKTHNYVEIGFPAFTAAGNDGLVSKDRKWNYRFCYLRFNHDAGTFGTPQKWTAIKNTITILTDDLDDKEKCIKSLISMKSWNKSGGAQPFISLGDEERP